MKSNAISSVLHRPVQPDSRLSLHESPTLRGHHRPEQPFFSSEGISGRGHLVGDMHSSTSGTHPFLSKGNSPPKLLSQLAASCLIDIAKCHECPVQGSPSVKTYSFPRQPCLKLTQQQQKREHETRRIHWHLGSSRSYFPFLKVISPRLMSTGPLSPRSPVNRFSSHLESRGPCPHSSSETNHEIISHPISCQRPPPAPFFDSEV